MPDVAVRSGPTGAGRAVPFPDDRERLTDAVTRASEECGYAAVDVDLIARYAGLGVEDFYQHFDSKDQCLMAAYDHFLEQMSEHISEACEGVSEWTERVRLTVEAAFGFVSELEGGARLFAVEAMRAGPVAVERSSAAIGFAAERLRHGRDLYPTAARMPAATERTLVAGLVLIVSVRLLGEDAEVLPGLAPEAVEMILTPYIGARRARDVAAA